VVWLIDARDGPHAESNDVLVDWAPAAPAPRHFSLFTVKSARGRRRDAFFATQSALAARERLNLLYVAATRAQRYLFVSGIDSERGQGSATGSTAGSAYDRLAAAVSAVAAAHGHTDTKAIGDIAVAVTAGSASASRRPHHALPGPAVRSYGKRLALTEAGRSGSLLHRILEYASAAPGLTHSAAQRDAVRRALGISENEFAPLWTQATAIVGTPQLRRFFDPGRFRRAENELEVLSGNELKRIDRLVEFDDEVWILDYKTGVAEPAAWRVQLANYRALLKPLFANKKMRSAVVMTDGGFEEFDG